MAASNVLMIFKNMKKNMAYLHDSTYYYNLHHNDYTHGLHYFPFPVNLDRCVESCNTLNDLSNKISIRYKTEDLNLSVFIMIT